MKLWAFLSSDWSLTSEALDRADSQLLFNASSYIGVSRLDCPVQDACCEGIRVLQHCALHQRAERSALVSWFRRRRCSK